MATASFSVSRNKPPSDGGRREREECAFAGLELFALSRLICVLFGPLKRSCAGMHTIIDLVGDEKKSKI